MERTYVRCYGVEGNRRARSARPTYWLIVRVANFIMNCKKCEGARVGETIQGAYLLATSLQ